MAPKMTLTHFDIDAVAEPVRFCLAMAGVAWEDKRVSVEEFPPVQPSEYSLRSGVFIRTTYHGI